VLERSRKRVVHVVVAAAIVHVAVSTILLATASSQLAPELAWCVAVAVVLGAVGALWYRARIRAIARLLAAVEAGAKLYRCEVTHVVGYHVIPLGYHVDLVAVDAANTRTAFAFGFWGRPDAERLHALLQPYAVAGPLPPFQITMWRPGGRGLPVAKARPRSDDAP
jgi:hypothetical protein